MLRGPSYAQVLRAIGQDLEASKLRYFDLKREGEEYLVRPAISHEPQELRYTAADIVRLEREGRAKRIDPSRTPDFSSLSQILRVIGQYIDRKDGYLLEVSKKAPSLGARVLFVRYKTTTGNPTKERFSASGVLALCVRMYKRRGR
jgi:hypothetical protein